MRVSALGFGPGLVFLFGLAATARASRLSPLDRLLRTRFPSTTAPPQLSADYDDSYEDQQDLDDLVTGAPLLNDDARHVWESRTHYSPHSQYKWNHLGSRTSINAYRNSKLGQTPQRHHTDNEVQQAVANALRVSRDHECRWPKQRLVRVKDVYPHPNKRYIPHCALLHQCGDDTGCCHGDTLSCVAANSQPVYLHFYTTTMNSGATVEKLKFYNHTECRCEDRTDMVMPRDMSYERRFQEKQIHSSCRCPTHFHVRRLHASTTCTCECFEEQHSCLRLRKGKDYFSHADRVCIQSGSCEVPACEFGSYLRKAGRCPRKKEKTHPWNMPSFRRY